ncbi:DNA mismatch repair protein [Algoriphagus sp.]|uniref:MutS-related protein n=1 Tax=Algoriphagus sp. TaxID=1872435 RepID=UPI0027210720|nr:DNA mismatch repair protein [Algoriphagus sp.]MDO8967993.1 DNA mismatch repair protein [Algoriphagus sp.]MDP3199065.1 DNA mismatch repair protein [Algoriphagus sp.]
MIDFDFKTERIPEKLKTLQSQNSRLSIFRLLTFFGTAALFVLGLAENPFWLLPAFLALGGFIKLIQKTNALKDQERIYLALEEMIKNQELRLSRNLATLDPGVEFSDKNHPFSGDLDLFGAHSLFQLLNHTTSKNGKRRLANLMMSSFDPETSQSRAAAVAELSKKRSFLDSVEAVGLAFQKEEKAPESWIHWLEEKEKSSVLISVLAFLGPLGGMVILALVYFGLLPQVVLGLWVLVGVAFLSRVFIPLKKAAESIPTAATLKSYRIRAQQIENEEFNSPSLLLEKENFGSAQLAASRQLSELDRLGLWAQNRLNLLYLPINLLFWTDFLLFIRLANWKRKVGPSLSHLPENLEKWEVWVSLGAFEGQLEGKGKVEWTQEVLLAAKELSHPLISPGKAIPNSIDFDSATRLVILTGANMSGKTTFMRTLGINCVLANLGLSPFGASLTLGPVQLYTSMRNSDNLGESVSSFYAELSRIHNLIERLESGEPLFFLLDEILKGTNTQDRISGSEALIHQILHTKGFGIISTHDIELSELEKSVEKVHNFSFHSEILDKSIDFDYKIKNGPCPSFNAHKLMELMGIRFQK